MSPTRVLAAEAARQGAGVRPKPLRRTAKDGTQGFKAGHINEAIDALKGLHWAVEDDCVSFVAGVLVHDGDFYRVISWQGERFRGAATPRVAVEAWKRGVKR